jgi:hypothetical protein
VPRESPQDKQVAALIRLVRKGFELVKANLGSNAISRDQLAAVTRDNDYLIRLSEADKTTVLRWIDHVQDQWEVVDNDGNGKIDQKDIQDYIVRLEQSLSNP